MFLCSWEAVMCCWWLHRETYRKTQSGRLTHSATGESQSGSAAMCGPTAHRSTEIGSDASNHSRRTQCPMTGWCFFFPYSYCICDWLPRYYETFIYWLTDDVSFPRNGFIDLVQSWESLTNNLMYWCIPKSLNLCLCRLGNKCDARNDRR